MHKSLVLLAALLAPVGFISVTTPKATLAAPAAEGALTLDPQSVYALTWRGFAHGARGDFAKAERDHATVIRRMPKEPDARTNRAETLVQPALQRELPGRPVHVAQGGFDVRVVLGCRGQRCVVGAASSDGSVGSGVWAGLLRDRRQVPGRRRRRRGRNAGRRALDGIVAGHVGRFRRSRRRRRPQRRPCRTPRRAWRPVRNDRRSVSDGPS